METDFQEAHISGMERIAAWSDLLDAINVFPVADGDTGRNLLTSLTPLRQPATDHAELIRRLLLSARGNSGNIAVQFFAGFLFLLYSFSILLLFFFDLSFMGFFHGQQ